MTDFATKSFYGDETEYQNIVALVEKFELRLAEFPNRESAEFWHCQANLSAMRAAKAHYTFHWHCMRGGPADIDDKRPEYWLSAFKDWVNWFEGDWSNYKHHKGLAS